jgi:hypothetical protein
VSQSFNFILFSCFRFCYWDNSQIFYRYQIFIILKTVFILVTPVRFKYRFIRRSSESRQNIIHQSLCGNKNRKKDFDLEECCIAAFKVPLKPIRKVKTCIDYEHILKTTPIGKFCILYLIEFWKLSLSLLHLSVSNTGL